MNDAVDSAGAAAARALRLHRDASRAFFGAVPPMPVPRLTRAAWAALLLLLRLPLVSRLLR